MIQSIYARALKRGFNPSIDLPIVQDHHVAEAPRSGRLRKQEDNKEEIITKVRRDRGGCEGASGVHRACFGGGSTSIGS